MKRLLEDLLVKLVWTVLFVWLVGSCVRSIT